MSDAKAILASLTDLDTFLILAVLLPLLRTLNALVKVCQNRDVYVQDVVDTVSNHNTAADA